MHRRSAAATLQLNGGMVWTLSLAGSEVSRVVWQGIDLHLQFAVVAAQQADPEAPLRPREGHLQGLSLVVADARRCDDTPLSPLMGRLREVHLQGGLPLPRQWPGPAAAGGRVSFHWAQGAVLTLQARSLLWQASGPTHWRESLSC